MNNEILKQLGVSPIEPQTNHAMRPERRICDSVGEFLMA
jgi:hypothetical protein